MNGTVRELGTVHYEPFASLELTVIPRVIMRVGWLFGVTLLGVISCGRSIRRVSEDQPGNGGKASTGGTRGSVAGRGSGGRPAVATGGSSNGVGGSANGVGGSANGVGGSSDGGAANTGAGGSAPEAGEGGVAGQSLGNAGSDDVMAGAGLGGSMGGSGTPGEACTVHVNQTSGTDEADGATWGTAVATVTRGLALTPPGCEIWITRGTYFPGTARDSTFHVEQGVTLRGGFDGGETTPDERMGGGHPTTLSGELGDPESVEDNAVHVVTTSDSTFDRIDVTGGNANDGSDGGGGILASGGVVLKACSIHENRTSGSGGGVLAHDEVTIETSTFTNNLAGELGGAVAALGSGPLTITGSVFTAGSAHSGAAVSTSSTSVSVTDSTFGQNVADELGGGIYTLAGSTLNVQSSDFSSNEALDGAAIVTFGALTLTGSSFANNECGQPNGIVSAHAHSDVIDSQFYANEGTAFLARDDQGLCDATVSGSTLDGNRATMGAGIHSESCTVSVSTSYFGQNLGGLGGAIAVESSVFTVSDSTFTGNYGDTDGGALFVDGSTGSLVNDDFFDNSANYGGAIAVYAGSRAVVNGSKLIRNNAVAGGGAIFVWESRIEIENTEIFNNGANAGGVLYSYAPGGEGMTLTNVTMTGNGASTGTALHATGKLSIRNSILWDVWPPEITLEADSTLALSASNLSGTYPYLTAIDPRFVDPTYDLRLRSDSPCIDGADDALAPSTDRLGNPRVDVPDVPLCPVETPDCGSIADMGAYEYGG